MALHPGEAGYDESFDKKSSYHRKSDLDEKHTLWDGDVERRIHNPTATEKLETMRKEESRSKEDLVFQRFESLSDPDWQKMTVKQLAYLLMLREFPPKERGGIKIHMSPGQAILTATWLKWHSFHPASHEWWFNFDTGLPEMSVEGKMSKARTEGWKLGAPRYKRIPEDRSKPLEAYQCFLPAYIIDKWQDYEYTADLKMFGFDNFGKRKPGLWSKDGGPEHMLRVRALDGCLKQIGFGFSEPVEVGAIPDEEEVVTAEQVKVKGA